jgi:hypothetical protein
MGQVFTCERVVREADRIRCENVLAPTYIDIYLKDSFEAPPRDAWSLSNSGFPQILLARTSTRVCDKASICGDPYPSHKPWKKKIITPEVGSRDFPGTCQPRAAQNQNRGTCHLSPGFATRAVDDRLVRERVMGLPASSMALILYRTLIQDCR